MAQDQQHVTTNAQDAVINRLVNEYGIERDRVLFLNPRKPTEPWLSADALTTIARKHDLFKTIDTEFAEFIAPLTQVVHRATVIDKQDRTFTRTGVATIGERAPDGDEIDEHALAAGRALRAALVAAGFDPTRAGSVVSINTKAVTSAPDQSFNQAAALKQIAATTPVEADAITRARQLGRLHIHATEAGLIRRDGTRLDKTEYHGWLSEMFGVASAAELTEPQLASAIEALRVLTSDNLGIAS